jgi:CysZ protein
MIKDATAAFAEIFSPRFRTVLWKVLALTAALLLLATAALHHTLLSFVHLSYPWLQTAVSVFAGVGLLLASIFLVAPISTLVAGFFVDDLAERVERDIDPHGEPGRALPLMRAAALSLRFAIVSVGVTALALVLLLVPGINAIAFVGANAYLLGRQYFEFAALRYRSFEDAKALRLRHWPTVLFAGLLIALFVSVPLLNLLTPLFGTALMVRVHKRLSRHTRSAAA